MKKPKLIIFGIVILIIGFIGGRMIGDKTSAQNSEKEGSVSAIKKNKVYTCSMHPQIRMGAPGDCPICSMPLVLIADQEQSSDNANTLKLSDYAIQMASIETSKIIRQKLNSEIKTFGDIHYDPQSLATITARVDGYAEKLFANISGVEIKANDHLLNIYSPDLLVAQQELLIALQSEKSGPLVESAKQKLRLWSFSEKQINEIIETKKVVDVVTLYSPISGTIIEKNIIENSAFKMGDVLYRIANLDLVWAHLDIYERDIALIRKGQKVDVTVEAYPGEVFTGTVSYLEPEIDEISRTLHLPILIENKDHKLRMGMYVGAIIKASLGADGKVMEPKVVGKYTCPMHPQILKEEPGQCPICNMDLEKVDSKTPEVESKSIEKKGNDYKVIKPELIGKYTCPMHPQIIKDEPGQCPICNMNLEKNNSESLTKEIYPLVVPFSAVLDSGTRKIVYVDKGGNIFESREVVLGSKAGDWFPVLSGLKEGERVVTRGGFLIDSQMQINGNPSLYYPGGLQANIQHHHGESDKSDAKENKDFPTPPANKEESTIKSNNSHQHK